MSTETTEETEATEEVETPEEEPTEETEATEQEPDTFPRSYVEELRDESARYRQRAQRADDLARRLHTALTAATGRLADPSDLPFEESHLEDSEALETAIEDLLARKPHLAARTPQGSIGQGATANSSTVDLAGILRAGAN